MVLTRPFRMQGAPGTEQGWMRSSLCSCCYRCCVFSVGSTYSAKRTPLGPASSVEAWRQFRNERMQCALPNPNMKEHERIKAFSNDLLGEQDETQANNLKGFTLNNAYRIWAGKLQTCPKVRGPRNHAKSLFRSHTAHPSAVDDTGHS